MAASSRTGTRKRQGPDAGHPASGPIWGHFLSAGHPDLPAAHLVVLRHPDPLAAAIVDQGPVPVAAAVERPAVAGRQALLTEEAGDQDLLRDGLPVARRLGAGRRKRDGERSTNVELTAKRPLDADLRSRRNGEPEEGRPSDDLAHHDAGPSAAAAGALRARAVSALAWSGSRGNPPAVRQSRYAARQIGCQVLATTAAAAPSRSHGSPRRHLRSPVSNHAQQQQARAAPMVSLT